MIGFTELVNADPRAFSDLADRWDQLADTTAAHYQDWQSHVPGPTLSENWTGVAGAAAG